MMAEEMVRAVASGRVAARPAEAVDQPRA